VQQQSRRDKWAGLPEEQRWLFVADDLDLHDELIEDVKRTASRMVWAVMVAAVSFAGQLIIVLSTIRGK
jgi:hypothetical protein